MTDAGKAAVARITELVARQFERELERDLERDVGLADLRRLKDMTGLLRDIEALRAEAGFTRTLEVRFVGETERASL